MIFSKLDLLLLLLFFVVVSSAVMKLNDNFKNIIRDRVLSSAKSTLEEQAVFDLLHNDPRNHTIHGMIGLIAHLRSDYTKSAFHYGTAFELSEFRIQDYLSQMIQSCRESGNLSEAVVILEKVIAHNPEEVFIYDTSLELTSELKLYDKYYNAILCALQVFPDYLYYLKFTDFLYHTKDNLSTQHYDSSEHWIAHNELILNALLLYPRCPFLLYHKAVFVQRLYGGENNEEYLKYLRLFRQSEKLYWADDTLRSEDRDDQMQEMHNIVESVWKTKAGTSEEMTGSGSSESSNSDNDSGDGDGLNTGISYVFNSTLQIGCSEWVKCVRPGWIIADAVETVSTHFVTTADDLRMIGSETIGQVYSSHTLEHLSHSTTETAVTPLLTAEGVEAAGHSEVNRALMEWNRVLVPGGTVMISVPNMMILAELFISPETTEEVRDVLNSIIYGGQSVSVDFHKNSFYFSKLKQLLTNANFCDIERVRDHNLFYDASIATIQGRWISLNVRARKCV